MRESVRQNLGLVERAILAFILPAVAGAINASGFFAVGAYTSHMTGAVARVGDELASGHLWLAARSAIFLGCFFMGAFASTLLVQYGKRAGGARYWRPLLLESALLVVFATVNVGSEQGANLNSLEMTALLCFAMGLQNALVTKIAGARIRNHAPDRPRHRRRHRGRARRRSLARERRIPALVLERSRSQEDAPARGGLRVLLRG